MSEDKGGRELTPREPGEVETADSSITPVEGESRDVERFSGGPVAHSAGLTEERSAQIVRQSANARNVVFLAILIIAIFIPVYWFYESGIPALNADGRLVAEAEAQYVTDVARGYELYLANCAECHGEDGQGGVGPRLNDQAKLYNVITPAGQPGSGHLNPDYLDNVLTVGGRYVCGDPNSLMAAWKEPNGPLNYRQVEELIVWMTASSDIVFERHLESHGEGDEEHDEPEMVAGWRDPNWQPGPDSTPPPACWKAPDGLVPAGTTTTGPAATPEPVDPGVTPEPIAGGTDSAPRVIRLDATPDLKFKDESGSIVPQIEVAAGETIEFVIDNVSGFEHNFWIGPQEIVSQPYAETESGIEGWESGEQTLTWTVEAGDVPLQFACTVPGHYGAGMFGNIVIQG
jgi:mono/diheme cytochrome c family protein